MKKIDLICIGFLIVVIVIIYFFTISSVETIDEQTAICVAEKSELYVLDTCGACKEQKKILGEYIELFNAVECAEYFELCSIVDITAVPTWFINGKKYIGIQSVNELKEITGC